MDPNDNNNDNDNEDDDIRMKSPDQSSKSKTNEPVNVNNKLLPAIQANNPEQKGTYSFYIYFIYIMCKDI